MGIEKALSIPQEERTEKLTNNEDILPFVPTYNPNNQNVFLKVREIYGNLQIFKTFGKTFAEHKLIIKDNRLIWKDFYVLETVQKINQLSKQQHAEKVAFVAIIL